MAGRQRIDIIGNLGGDPEMRIIADGKPVTNFTVAVNTKSGDKEYTDWFRVSVWGKLAEICNKYLHKGSLVSLAGRMNKPKPFQRKDGEWDASLEMTAFEMLMLGSRSDSESAAPVKEDEIPF